jgi:hypothetical protein
MVNARHIPKPIVDIVVGEASGSARSFLNPEDPQAGLYCTFECKSWATKKPNTATVTIHNLGEDTWRYLEKPNLILTVNAGADIPGQLFRGAISRDGVITVGQKENRVTTIKAADGRRAYRDAPFVRSYPKGASVLNRIIPDIAAAMDKPLRVSARIPPELRSFTIPTGWSFVHPARDALTEVLLPFGLDWAIIGGTLYILSPLEALPGNAPLISPDTGLHDRVERTKKGCKFKTVLNPAIIASQASVVRSEDWSGTIRNDEVKHKGNTRATEWYTRAMGTKI